MNRNGGIPVPPDWVTTPRWRNTALHCAQRTRESRLESNNEATGRRSSYERERGNAWYLVTSQFLVQGPHETQLAILPLVLGVTSLTLKPTPLFTYAGTCRFPLFTTRRKVQWEEKAKARLVVGLRKNRTLDPMLFTITCVYTASPLVSRRGPRLSNHCDNCTVYLQEVKEEGGCHV